MLTARRPVTSPTPQPIPIRKPERSDADARSRFWERAAILFTVFVGFQVALLSLLGL